MAKILDIKQLGDPILREKAIEVKNIHDPELKSFTDDLIKTMIEKDNGIGISAPQVGRSEQIFIFGDVIEEEDKEIIETYIAINPKILSHSDTTDEDWEGCLSVPERWALIKRYEKVDVEYFTLEGKKIKATLGGLAGRVFQHEIDHLNGILFIDKTKSPHDIYTEEEFQKLMEENQHSEIKKA